MHVMMNIEIIPTTWILRILGIVRHPECLAHTTVVRRTQLDDSEPILSFPSNHGVDGNARRVRVVRVDQVIGSARDEIVDLLFVKSVPVEHQRPPLVRKSVKSVKNEWPALFRQDMLCTPILLPSVSRKSPK